MTTDVPMALYVAGSTLIDGLAGGAVLFASRGPGPGAAIGLGRLVRAAAAIGGSFLIKMPVWWLLGVRMFGWTHLVYADLVVLLPVLGAMLGLVALPIAGRPPRIRLTIPARLLAAAALSLAAVGAYATWIEPFDLRIESARVDVPDGRAGGSTIRVGVMTDIQTSGVTDYERRAVATLMAQKPDLILLPGDVFQGTAAELEATRASLHDLLASLSAPGGVFLVLGDVDQTGDHLRDILEGTGVRLLVNESATVELGDRRLTIGGVELVYHSAGARSLVERLETTPGDDDIRILVAHRPDVVLGLRPGSRVDLVVAGHTHGGQVVIPGFGPPVTLSGVPRSVAAGGLHRMEGNAIYVSRGVGHERGQAPRIRFFCPPEVSVVEIGDPRRRPHSG